MQTSERIDIRKQTRAYRDWFGSKKGDPDTINLFDE